MCADNESFGLTDEVYQFLLDDIDRAIAEGNRKYGYGEDASLHPLPSNSPRSRPRVRSKRPSIEEVSIARGLIKTNLVTEESDRGTGH
jgi:hypothetical protein